jgi:hypothetical protein
VDAEIEFLGVDYIGYQMETLELRISISEDVPELWDRLAQLFITMNEYPQAVELCMQ